MSKQIYYVGGASAAGKSTITKELALRAALPLVELDKFHDLLSAVIRVRKPLIAATRKVALTVVVQLLHAQTGCIIEGGWIKPALAHRLKKNFGSRFCPVYCGYPQADMATRYLAIQARGTHWLKNEPEPEAHAFLATQIKESEAYRQECERFQLEFFDFTDFSEGSHSLRAHFETWLQNTAASASSYDYSARS